MLLKANKCTYQNKVPSSKGTIHLLRIFCIPDSQRHFLSIQTGCISRTIVSKAWHYSNMICRAQAFCRVQVAELKKKEELAYIRAQAKYIIHLWWRQFSARCKISEMQLLSTLSTCWRIITKREQLPGAQISDCVSLQKSHFCLQLWRKIQQEKVE